MNQKLKAIFRNGAFVPQQLCDLPEGAQVELIVQDPTGLPPEVSDPAERRKILKALVESIRQNPFPEDAPRFTREQMHDRR